MVAHRLSDPVGVLNYVIVMQFLDRKPKEKQKTITKSCKKSRINNNNRKYSPTRIAAIAGICSTVGCVCVCVFTVHVHFVRWRRTAPVIPAHHRIHVTRISSTYTHHRDYA